MGIVLACLLAMRSVAAADDESASGGELLYNGIRLPAEWPPNDGDSKSNEPMLVPYLTKRPDVVPIDVGRQFFVDDFLIETTNLKRTFHQAVKYEGNPVFRPTTPEELGGGSVCYLGHGGVFYDPSERLFKMWYTAGWRGGLALATSRDAKVWQRPAVGPAGSNLLLPAGQAPGTAGGDNCVWFDTNDPQQRIKFLTNSKGVQGATHLLTTSADQKSWTDPIPAGQAADYCSFFFNPFRDVWSYSIKRGGPRGRCRYYAEHAEFLTPNVFQDSVYWANADRLDLPDPAIGDAPQLYSLSAVAYESVLVGMFQILLGPENKVCARGKFPKKTELKLGFSRDGFHWDRPVREPFLAPTGKVGDWERGYLHTTTGIFLVVGDQLYFPYCGYSGIGAEETPGMYNGATVGLAMLRRDGFASMDADTTQGTLTTRPIRFTGKHLFVNVACPAGELRVEVLDRDGQVLPEFAAHRCQPVKVDRTLQQIKWDGAAVESVAGKPVRLRFKLTKGQLYSFWTSNTPNGASGGYLAAGGPGYESMRDNAE